MKFAFYLENEALKVAVGDKLPMTQIGKAPGMLTYAIKHDSATAEDSVTLCDDNNDQNYLSEKRLNALPEEITATVSAVETVFGGVREVTFSIDELEAVENM